MAVSNTMFFLKLQELQIIMSFLIFFFDFLFFAKYNLSNMNNKLFLLKIVLEISIECGYLRKISSSYLTYLPLAASPLQPLNLFSVPLFAQYQPFCLLCPANPFRGTAKLADKKDKDGEG